MSFLQLRSRRFNDIDDNPEIIISTQAVTSVAGTTATANGTLTNSGGSPITAMGFVWDVNPNPTLANNVLTVANTTGLYTGNLTGLPSSTLIFYDAYATNASGTVYGGDQSFTTTGAGATQAPLELQLLGVG